jgi:hypothetical protein
LKDGPVIFVDTLRDVLLEFEMIAQKRLGDFGVGLECMYGIDIGANDFPNPEPVS